MYKSKLQEMCHRKQWQLPEYMTIKEGPPHNPRFQTTVTVNDLTFTNHNPCKNTKESQNDAAKLAFLHFTSSSSASGSSSPSAVQLNIQETEESPQDNATAAVPKDLNSSKDQKALGSSSPRAVQPNVQETEEIPQGNATAAVPKDAKSSKDQKVLVMPHLYKNQLQSYAQKRNLALPTYSWEREGPPHASLFKSKVTIDGQTYESPTFFSTLKEAEHGAAKVALMSLSSDGVQEDDSILYKNLLQELIQKEGYALPLYKASQFGEVHVPTFISTVEVEGEVFTGHKAKTKKQAEMSAAKVAYITIKERKASQGPKFLSPTRQAPADHPSSYPQSNVAVNLHHQHIQSSHLQSNVTANLHQDIQPTDQGHWVPIWKEVEEHEVNDDEDDEDDDDDDLLDHFPQPQPEINPTYKRKPSSTVLSAPSSLPSNVSGGTVTDSRPRIRVLPCTPNKKFPKDSTVVHRDERFVALKLGSQSNQ